MSLAVGREEDRVVAALTLTTWCEARAWSSGDRVVAPFSRGKVVVDELLEVLDGKVRCWALVTASQPTPVTARHRARLVAPAPHRHSYPNMTD